MEFHTSIPYSILERRSFSFCEKVSGFLTPLLRIVLTHLSIQFSLDIHATSLKTFMGSGQCLNLHGTDVTLAFPSLADFTHFLGDGDTIFSMSDSLTGLTGTCGTARLLSFQYTKWLLEIQTETLGRFGGQIIL